MKIKSAVFVKGITGTDEILNNGIFQVALLGRSNVGKSTLINSLTMKKNLARSSSSPGKTIRMDFFLINRSFYFVDFPGYGYAKHSWEMRDKLAKMLLWYVMYSGIKNRFALLIIDAKVGITPYDADMIKTLYEYRVRHIIVANKADKLSSSQLEKQVGIIKLDYPNSEIVAYSCIPKYRNVGLMEKISSEMSRIINQQM
ncbi:ribosome biogenesis GTP-binding protein YsxC [Candidatus Gottesmanbacteria bacterium]|nr:ribosome biogenesis GTP-binding protein YsxC [Candidatus Gottesmanbacteria bacterium]